VDGRWLVLGPVDRGGGACFWVVVWELLDVLVVVVLVVVVVVGGGEDVVEGGGAGVDEVVDVVDDGQVTPGIGIPVRGTQVWMAEAFGIAARPTTSAAAPAAATGILSFLRLNTVV
jgi:hypothetical protein